ncbi:DUF2946 family protein [Bradyrhizobium jicamae]|uniref:DUF2946 family protein n=1 Tax=Bradyrhizobium jicamae TaxID=280332 RepID=A0ABS5FUI2_9BRAD|nr:DUF2946 family protein [Bradyrhizobium jicamae]MBR0800274.1 DUF2946 family protein [Bradyrhizobium jicamae]
MKWFRANIRQGSRLALLALAIQFVLSFGHVHESHARAAPGDVQHAVRTVSAPVPQVVRDAGASWFIPSWVVRSRAHSDGRSDHHGLADDCPICAVLALASTMLSATPPELPAPLAAEFAYLITNAAPVDVDWADAAFQPRGPPVI